MRPDVATWALGLALLALASAASAQKDAREVYFEGRELTPDGFTQETLDALAANRPTGPTDKPVKVGERAIRFVYGADLPTVVCAPMRVCDIALEPGEQVLGEPILGDDGWKVTPGISGPAGKQVWHLYVSPKDVGLETTLAINTDRRAYHLQLASRRRDYVAHVSFSYPENRSRTWADFQRKYGRPASAARRTRTRASAKRPRGPNLAALSFAYEITGDNPAWRPVRVYNDAKRTVVELPKHVASTGLPVLLPIRHEGVFSDSPDPYNQRTYGNRIVIDGVPNIMHLVRGNGSSQLKVTIRRIAEDDQ